MSWLLFFGSCFCLGFCFCTCFRPLVPASASVSARDLCFLLRVGSRFICFCPLRLSWFLFRLLLFASVLACVLGLVSVLAISSVRALAFLSPFAFRPLCWLLLWPLLLAIASVLVSVLALASVSALAFSYRFWPLLPCLCFGSRFCRGFCLGSFLLAIAFVLAFAFGPCLCLGFCFGSALGPCFRLGSCFSPLLLSWLLFWPLLLSCFCFGPCVWPLLPFGLLLSALAFRSCV